MCLFISPSAGSSSRGGRASSTTEDLIARFLALEEEAWRREDLPFHIWLTSPALEILDVTFTMNRDGRASQTHPNLCMSL